MDIKKLMQERFAAKGFGKKASKEKIEELLEIIRLSPSSYNTQPWRIFVVEGSEELVDISYGQRQVAEGTMLMFCYVKDRERLVTENNITGMAREYILSMDQQEYECWAGKQVYLALGIAVVAAKALGLDACPMEGFDREAWKEFLGIEHWLEPSVLLAVGLEGKGRRRKERMPLEKIARWISREL